MARLGAFVAVVLLCGLAACEDEPTPDIPDPTPSTSSPSVSESVSPTTPTEAPEALTPEETVRAWFKAWSTALITGEVEQVSALSSPDCGSCSRLIAQLQSIYDRGGRIETDGWTPLTSVLAPDSSDEQPRFLLRVAESRRVLFDADGEEVDDTPRTEVPMRMTLENDSGVWVVARLEILK
jgi:hypothetical protein